MHATISIVLKLGSSTTWPSRTARVAYNRLQEFNYDCRPFIYVGLILEERKAHLPITITFMFAFSLLILKWLVDFIMKTSNGNFSVMVTKKLNEILCKNTAGCLTKKHFDVCMCTCRCDTQTCTCFPNQADNLFR